MTNAKKIWQIKWCYPRHNENTLYLKRNYKVAFFEKILVLWCFSFLSHLLTKLQEYFIQRLAQNLVIPLFFNINHPTMAIFISSSGAFPFLQIDQEVKCFLNLKKNKNMPTKEKMLERLQHPQYSSYHINNVRMKGIVP